MDEIITKWPLVGQVVLYIVGFNLFLSGLKASIDAIKDKTTSDVDNKVSAFLEKPIAWLAKIIDMIGFNPAHSKDKK